MDYRLESEIWLAAQRHMTAKAFLALIEQSVRTYRRHPGHYSLERMHAIHAHRMPGRRKLGGALLRSRLVE